ncbi:MAG: YdcF family protein [Cystobacter sp.]
MSTLTMQHARRLWEYMSSFKTRAPCDVAVVCCSYDLRVCDYACELLKSGLARQLLISGNTGNWTRHLWSKSEARVFLARAQAAGIPESSIILEERATNFGENIALSRELVPHARTVTFITKPNSVLRVLLTAAVRWPGITAQVDCPVIDFPEEVSNIVGVLGLIDEMVGDVHRIIEYPQQGFQQAHALPSEVLESWRYLISQGFKNHLIPNRPIDAGRG